MLDPLVVSPALTIPPRELAWTAVRASGPGGQNVNKVASKVELRFDLEGSQVLSFEVRARLRVIARSHLDAEGRVLVVSQKTRDQLQNLRDAREKLKDMLVRALVRPLVRRKTKPTYGSVLRRIGEKKHQGDKKRARRPDAE